MSQNPLVDTGAKSSKTPELKPVLAAALASLEVQLDQELARYRRTRFTYKTLSQTRMGVSTSSKFQQITATPTTEVKIPSPVTNSSEEISLTQFSTTVPSTPKPETQQVPGPIQEETAQQYTSKMPSTPPAPNSASIVPAFIKTNQSDNLVKPESNPKPPDDYLESSEALLRSLTEEQSPTQKRNNSNDSLLSPLGIGSMLLMLMASLSLGYAVFNPKSLPNLNLGSLFKKNTPDNQPTTANNQSATTTVAEPELTPIPKFPNLANSEFPEIKGPNDVVALTPKPKPTPIAVSTPIATQNPTVAPKKNTIETMEAQPTFSPTPSPTVAASTPATPTPTPTLQNIDDPGIKPSRDGFFHIFTDNQDEKSLAKVRQVVPDAYLSKDKKSIYLGAFKTKEQVKKQMQFLQSKGITAKVE
ncbi:hypothetical protein [Fischerella thermalis]|uniref:hypothetical protein n=1 Tax=Fischerella thermalis TaxID=372787 RepID=UPI0019EC6E42|nr:hypothetical protein [Fischerella thermalis]MBF1989568.1 hypothetical protein [Fischerella thermalis M58_A2018_009]MBF2061389.1 hypothetical protein [Fischerella thermalis M66_A2018_004]